MSVTASLENSLDGIRATREMKSAPLLPRDFGVRSLGNITEQIKGLKSLGVPETITTKVDGISKDLIRKTERLLEGLKIDKQKIDAIVAPVLAVILSFLGDRSIPDDVKDRYMQVAREAVDDLSEVTIEQILSVKNRQTEIAGPFASTDSAYYLSEILKARVSGQLGFSESVAKAFHEERIKAPDGSEYQKENLGKYVLSVQGLDKKFGTHIHEKIILPLLAGKIQLLPDEIQTEMRIGRNLSSANLSYIVGRALLDELNQRAPLNGRQTLLNFLKAGNLSELSIPIGSPDRYVTVNGEKIDLIKVLLGNNQSSSYFQAYENEARSIRSTAKGGKDGLFSNTPNFEGGKLISGDISESMKGMNIQQILILLSQLIPILPTVGSIAGAIDSGRNMANGINMTGENVNMPLEGLSTLADTLDSITLGVGQFGKLIKAKKIAEALGRMKRVLSQLPTILERALAQEKMTDAKAKFIEKIGILFTTLGPALEKIGINTKDTQDVLFKSISHGLNKGEKMGSSKIDNLPNALRLNDEIAALAKQRGVKEDVIRKEFLIQREGLTPAQAERVIDAHNKVKGSLGNYGIKQLAEKIRIMTREGEGKLTKVEARKMLIKGYAGKADEILGEQDSIKIKEQLNRYGPDFLERFSGQTASQGLLDAVAEFNNTSTTKELAEFLELYDIKYEMTGLQKALDALSIKGIEKLIGRVKLLKFSEIPAVIDSKTAELAISFIREGSHEEVGRYIKKLGEPDSSSSLRILFNQANGEKALDAVLGLESQGGNIAGLLRGLIEDDRIVGILGGNGGEKLVKLLIKNKIAFEGKVFEGLLSTLRVKIGGGLRLLIDHFLKFDSTNEQTIAQLKDKKSALYNLWNMDFEDLRTEAGGVERRLLMVQKGDISFFRVSNLEHFFYMGMSRLDRKIYEDFIRQEVADPKGKYHTFIKERPKILSVIMLDFPIERYAFMHTLTS
ncbi:MAG: hypothetical protein HHAS10_08770 [Candidatus Altimarinota bacterium]